MTPRPTTSSVLVNLTRAVGVALVYTAGIFIGVALTDLDTGSRALWLPSGIYLSVLLLSQRRHWGYYVGAVCTATLLFNYCMDRPLWLSAAFCSANTLEAVAATALLRWRERRGVQRSSLRWYATLVAVLCGVTGLLSAPWGALLLWTFGDAPFFLTWLMWGTRNTLGSLIVVPLVLTWASRHGPQPLASLRRRIPEAFLIYSGLALMTYEVFIGPQQLGLGRGFLVLPFTLAAALRFGLRGATVAGLLLAVSAAFFSIRSLGEDRVDPWRVAVEIAALQAFLAINVLAALAAAAVLTERLATIAALRASEARLEQLGRCHAVVGRIAEAAARSDDRDALLQQACVLAVRHGQIAQAWVTLCDTERGGLSKGSVDGSAPGLIDALDLDSGLPTEQLREILADGRHHLSVDVARDPLFEPWHEAISGHGFRTVLAISLHTGTRWFGCFFLFSTQREGFSKDAADVLTRTSSDLSYAIEAMALEAARRQAEDERRRLAALIEHSDEFVGLATGGRAPQH